MLDKKYFPSICIFFLILVISRRLWISPAFSLMGYYVTMDEDRLAEHLFENHLPVSDCQKLIHFDPLAPGREEKRIGCIIHYAQIAHDPSVCERLMPSRYGLDCVGAAMKNDQCNFYGNFTVSWGEGKATLKECQKPNRKRGKKGDQCCIIANASYLRSFNNCSSLLGDQAMFDECQFHVAFKNKDPFWCSAIKDANIHAACVISAEALKKDPSICTGCASPVEKIEDLP